MRSRGKYFKKEVWLSICSRHREYEESCNICNTGKWENVIKLKLSGLFYDISPVMWRYWINRKH